MEVGAAPLSAERIQHVTPAAGSEAPKEHSPMLPEPQTPRSPLDLSAGKQPMYQITASVVLHPRPLRCIISFAPQRAAVHRAPSHLQLKPRLRVGS